MIRIHSLQRKKLNVIKICDVLKSLIQRKLVVAMFWNEELQEYKRSFIYDSDNMNAYSYLATKEGLLAHNSR